MKPLQHALFALLLLLSSAPLAQAMDDRYVCGRQRQCVLLSTPCGNQFEAVNRRYADSERNRREQLRAITNCPETVNASTERYSAACINNRCQAVWH